MANCFRAWLDCFQGPSYTATTSYAHLNELPTVKLDSRQIGTDVVIVKNGRRICGTGAALGNTPIAQDKAYFEVKLQQTGSWCIGLATKHVDVNSLPLGKDEHSWVLRDDNSIYSNAIAICKLQQKVEEGDCLGITFDHVEMKIYINGTDTNVSVNGIKGTVFPVLSVDDGAILDVHFGDFMHKPPSGFEEIMMEQTIL